jgi:hypothetical protein
MKLEVSQITHSSSDAVDNPNNSNEASSQENSKAAAETDIAYNQINDNISNDDEINQNSFTNPLALANMDVNELLDDNNNANSSKSNNNNNNNETKFAKKNENTTPKKTTNKNSNRSINNLNNSLNYNNTNNSNIKPFDLFTSS